MRRYHSIALQIEKSCCNCTAFVMDDTMLSGTCRLDQKNKSAVGTCDQFVMKYSSYTSLRKKEKE